jgi:hypothetical protein
VPSGITIQGGWFHDIDPSRAETGSAFHNDGAIRACAWQNVLVEGVRFTNCATAISLYVASDFPTDLGSPRSFVIRNNTLESCGLARADGIAVELIRSSSARSGIVFRDVQIRDNAVAGDWVAGTEYFVATWDTFDCWITGNHFAPTGYSLAEERAHNKYKAQGPTNTGTWDLSGNTVSDGSVDNS